MIIRRFDNYKKASEFAFPQIKKGREVRMKYKDGIWEVWILSKHQK